MTDIRFVHAELTNATVDPLLAAREPERIASRDAALRAIDQVA